MCVGRSNRVEEQMDPVNHITNLRPILDGDPESPAKSTENRSESAGTDSFIEPTVEKPLATDNPDNLKSRRNRSLYAVPITKPKVAASAPQPTASGQSPGSGKKHAHHVNLNDSAFYLNRELTWLEFNRRVLHEAEDERTPLLERIKFVAIVSSNLDEFFMKGRYPYAYRGWP